MARSGPRRVRSYSPEFKLRAVQLSQQPGVLIRDVAESSLFTRSCSLAGESRPGTGSYAEGFPPWI